jgi:prophage tail gpP-like protein
MADPIELPTIVVEPGLAAQLGEDDIGKNAPGSLADQAGLGDIGSNVPATVRGGTQDQDEIAKVIVAGFEYQEWESVWVQITAGADFAQFRFTCGEKEPYPDMTAVLQFVPGEEVIIELAGRVVLFGVIITRQVAYDAKSHGVVIQGVGITWYAARASILDKDSNYDGMTFLQIAAKVLAPTGVGFRVRGTIDPTPYKRISPQHGEFIFPFLERIGRDRKVIVSVDETRFTFTGDHPESVRPGDLVEGINIKKMQCVWTDDQVRSEYFTDGQTAGGDDKNMQDAAGQRAQAPGSAARYSPLLSVVEHPVWDDHEIAKRNEAEQWWREGSKLEATITVYGWLNPQNDLWAIYQTPYVWSPMAILDQMMVIKQVTFTQDNEGGSQTTLLCVAPWLLNDDEEYATGPNGTPTPRPNGNRTHDNNQPATTPAPFDPNNPNPANPNGPGQSPFDPSLIAPIPGLEPRSSPPVDPSPIAPIPGL